MKKKNNYMNKSEFLASQDTKLFLGSRSAHFDTLWPLLGIEKKVSSEMRAANAQ